MRVTVIKNGQIINIVEAIDLQDAQQSYPECTARAALNTDRPVMPVPPTRFISAQAFRDRFTEAELLLMLVSITPGVRLLVLKVSTAAPEGIDMLSATMASGLAYLVAQGILAAGRPAQITA